jgi:uncharacterized lipoprotein YajG
LKSRANKRNGIPALVILVLSACASSPEPLPDQPPWVISVEDAYPNDQFIAQRGRGKSRQEAEMAALALISRIFSNEITAIQESVYTSVEQNGISNDTSRVGESISVNSQTELFAVHYAEDAWINPGTKEWETIAFIDRSEAWEIYRNEVQQQIDGFTALFESAENEMEPVKQAFAFRIAQRFADSDNYQQVMNFGQILSPQKMDALMRLTRERIAAIPQRTSNARQQSQLFIDCSSDYNSLLISALTNVFKVNDFPIVKTFGEAKAICSVAVDEGLQASEQGNMYYPSVVITIKTKNGETVFSYAAKAERQGAVTAEVAKRRAYTSLANEIESSLSKELDKTL